ncbi:hypothetical protein V9T40_000893 [Parthenolecanium corni]|uniref:Meckel syndrome type 1 protein n=1 Tax=Parthenolecanium corni TaxID=536013 RepID=A0AAN9TBY7_9HEMI
MFYKNELDFMPGTYKCYGDVKHLRFKVRLEILKSSMIPLSNVEESGTGLDPQYNEREEAEFTWNEKVFSPSEFKMLSVDYQRSSEVEKEYHEKVRQHIAEGTSVLTNRLFSYTSKDMIPSHLHRNILYSQDRSQAPFQVDSESLSSSLRQTLNITSSAVTDHVSLPVRNIVDCNPSDELRIQNRSLSSGHETMYIVADLSEKLRENSDPVECAEHLLVTIKWNKKTRTLTVIPDFASFSTLGYKIEVDALNDTRYVYRYWIINISQHEEGTSLERIEKISNEFAANHRNVTFSMDFEIPSKNMRNIFVFAEIKKAVDFSNDNLFIRYLISLPEGWLTENPEKLNGITPLNRYRKTNNVSSFSYIFELKLSCVVKNVEDENFVSKIHGPQLFFEVCSLDGWKRFRVEGYAWTTLPTSSGRYQLILDSWRPAPVSRRDELKRHFIGTDPQILDISFPGFPSDCQNNLISRCGLETISSGTIYLELNIIYQHSTTISQTKKSSLPADRKTAMLMNSVNHILEAFKKARQRMLLAREPILLHTGSINTVYNIFSWKILLE